MRPSALPGLIQAVGRNARRGFPGAASVRNRSGVRRATNRATRSGRCRRRPAAAICRAQLESSSPDEDIFYSLEGRPARLLRELGAPASLADQHRSNQAAWWRPGRSASLRLGKIALATFGELHPATLAAMDVEGPMLAFEISSTSSPSPSGARPRPSRRSSCRHFMPLTRDFAFVVDRAVAGGDLERALLGVDRNWSLAARVFDVYAGPGRARGQEIDRGRGQDPAARSAP